jgi:hypothetical protein
MTKFDAGPFDHNGAAVAVRRDAGGRLKYDIHNAAGGDPVRSMYDRDEAVAFALSLPVPEGLEPILPPSPINLSRRAAARARELGLDVPQPVPEPSDGAPDRSMSEARRRSGAGPSDRKLGIASRPRVPK